MIGRGIFVKEAILLIAHIINDIHDLLVDRFGLHMTDKELHFWVFGIVGIVTFFIVYVLFKVIANMKWCIAIILFICRFCVVVVFVVIVSFFIFYVLFKVIANMKWSIAILSFIYTFTVMVVLVFAIELQQALTNRGNMEFADAVMGLWGFLVFFAGYAVVALLGYIIIHIFKKK